MSFAAWGRDARKIIENHSLDYALSDQSPLGRIYELGGYILLLGAPTDSNSSLHLAEYKQNNSFVQPVVWDVKMRADGKEKWVTYQDINNDSDDFNKIFDDFNKETNYVLEGRVGEATCYLIPQKEMVDYAVDWMNKNRS